MMRRDETPQLPRRARRCRRPRFALCAVAAALAAAVGAEHPALADVVWPCHCDDECLQASPQSVCYMPPGTSFGACCPGSSGCPPDPGPGIACPKPDGGPSADVRDAIDSGRPTSDAALLDLGGPPDDIGTTSLPGDDQPVVSRGCACDTAETAPLANALVLVLVGLVLLWRLHRGRGAWPRRRR